MAGRPIDSEKIRSLIRMNGWTQNDFADKIGYSYRHFSRCLNRRMAMSEMVSSMSRVLGVTANSLIVDIQFVLAGVLSRIAQPYYYTHTWTDEYARKEMNRAFNEMYHLLKKNNYNILDNSQKELCRLGFKYWDDDQTLLLIPLWAWALIPDGTKLKSIFDTHTIKGKDSIDMDVRFNCLAWGIEVEPDD